MAATPLLRATRQVFPRARITLVTGPGGANVLEGCPFVDRTVAFDPYHVKTGRFAYIQEMLRIRREEQPQVALIVDNSLRAALGALLAGARVRVGDPERGRRPLLTGWYTHDPDRSAVQYTLDTLRVIAPDSPEAPYDPLTCLWVTEEERRRGVAILEENGAVLGGSSLLVAIQPGARQRAKQWPEERFAAVADALSADGAAIILLGGPEERESAQAMRRAMHTPVVDLTGACSLRETLGVLTHIPLFIGNDTGVNQIAGALGLATVQLFGPTPRRPWENNGPLAETLESRRGVMEEISVEEVKSTALRLLARVREQGSRAR